MSDEEYSNLRREIADAASEVLAASDRASPFAIADRILAIPKIAAAVAYHQLGSNVGMRYCDLADEHDR